MPAHTALADRARQVRPVQPVREASQVSLVDLAAAAPAMASPAGEARFAAALARIERAVADAPATGNLGWHEIPALIRDARDRVAVRHQEVTGPEHTFYLVWRANAVLSRIGWPPLTLDQVNEGRIREPAGRGRPVAAHLGGMTEQKTPNPGKTTDGVDIVEGLVVWTNEMRPGVVRLDRWSQWSPDWFDVEYAGGGRVMQNGKRVATRFEGRSAQAAYAEADGSH